MKQGGQESLMLMVILQTLGILQEVTISTTSGIFSHLINTQETEIPPPQRLPQNFC